MIKCVANQQKFIVHSSGDWEVQKSMCWSIISIKFASWLQKAVLLSPCLVEREASYASSYKGTNSIDEGSTSKYHPIRVRFQLMNFEKIQTFRSQLHFK